MYNMLNQSNPAEQIEMENGSVCSSGRGRGRRPISDLNDDNSYSLRRPYMDPPEVASNSSTDSSVKSTYDAQSSSDRSYVERVIMSYHNENQSPGCLPIHEIGNLTDQFSNVLSTVSISNNTLTMPKVASSTLSAEAPEFVPRHHTTQPAPHFDPPCDTVRIHQASVLEANMIAGVADPGLLHISGPQFKYVHHPVILQVNNIVVTLTMKPHKFDQIASQMTSILSWKVKDADLMKEIIAVIFEQGVGEPNFRFNGGRLCQHLTKNVTQTYEGHSFKTLLLQKCQNEYNCREYYLQTEPIRLCGFTLFLADIFVHLVTPTGQPLDKLREGICQLLLALMTSPTPSNLKCVAQVLKGSGSSLDASDGELMEIVMNRVKDIAMTFKAPANISNLLFSVVELRAANWGRGPNLLEEISSTSEPDVPHIGTVYYGPGGVIQRVEEDNDDSASDTDDSFYGLPPQSDELEDEIEKAFEEFLRSQDQGSFSQDQGI